MAMRDMGTCCLFFPLKVGVGLVAMYTFASSLLCILALFSGDIRFQPNGYNLSWYWVYPIVGSFGLFLGFVGLLGVYDDKIIWLRIFGWYVIFKLVVMGLSVVADYYTLRQCETWLSDPTHTWGYNPQMYALASREVCNFARWSYVLGAGMDFSFNAYLVYCTMDYIRQVMYNPPYAIDFGLENYDVTGRWKLYHAKAPQFPPSIWNVDTEKAVDYTTNEDTWDYGTMEATQTHAIDRMGEYGPDGMPRDDLFKPAGGGKLEAELSSKAA